MNCCLRHEKKPFGREKFGFILIGPILSGLCVIHVAILTHILTLRECRAWNDRKSLKVNILCVGGEGGIRTRGTRIEYTAFPVLHLRPLGHLSNKRHTLPIRIQSNKWQLDCCKFGLGQKTHLKSYPRLSEHRLS